MREAGPLIGIEVADPCVFVECLAPVGDLHRRSLIEFTPPSLVHSLQVRQYLNNYQQHTSLCILWEVVKASVLTDYFLSGGVHAPACYRSPPPAAL